MCCQNTPGMWKKSSPADAVSLNLRETPGGKLQVQMVKRGEGPQEMVIGCFRCRWANQRGFTKVQIYIFKNDRQVQPGAGCLVCTFRVKHRLSRYLDYHLITIRLLYMPIQELYSCQKNKPFATEKNVYLNIFWTPWHKGTFSLALLLGKQFLNVELCSFIFYTFRNNLVFSENVTWKVRRANHTLTYWQTTILFSIIPPPDTPSRSR